MVGDRSMGDGRGTYIVRTKPGWAANAEAHESGYCGFCGGGGCDVLETLITRNLTAKPNCQKRRSGGVFRSKFPSKLLS